jgi:hypothetical protein
MAGMAVATVGTRLIDGDRGMTSIAIYFVQRQSAT